MRDLDRWKDKVELSLDGRQIFFLFFGSAVAACLIFVVGVLIGKRIEARALALQPAPIEDPLAALDQLGDADEADDNLTFHKALAPTHADKPAERTALAKAAVVDDDGDEVEAKPEPRLEGKGEAKLEGKGEAKLDAKGEAKPEAKGEAKPEGKGEAKLEGKGEAKLEGKGEAKLEGKGEAKLEGKGEPKKPEPRAPFPARPLPLPPSRPQVVQATPPKKPDAPKKPEATSAHFTLQLSAFPEKSDAEEFMHKMQAAGYKPFLVASEVPGKGIFYRVRVGDYPSRQAAVDAKTEFEKKQRIIAYVAKL